MSDVQFPAPPATCQEAVFLFPKQTKPFSCGHPATRFVGWPDRGEGPYRMCDQHADHSVRNRRATDHGLYVPGGEPIYEGKS